MKNKKKTTNSKRIIARIIALGAMLGVIMALAIPCFADTAEVDLSPELYTPSTEQIWEFISSTIDSRSLYIAEKIYSDYGYLMFDYGYLVAGRIPQYLGVPVFYTLYESSMAYEFTSVTAYFDIADTVSVSNVMSDIYVSFYIDNDSERAYIDLGVSLDDGSGLMVGYQSPVYPNNRYDFSLSSCYYLDANGNSYNVIGKQIDIGFMTYIGVGNTGNYATFPLLSMFSGTMTYYIGALRAGYLSGYEDGVFNYDNLEYIDGYKDAVKEIKDGDFGRNLLGGLFEAPLKALNSFTLIETPDGVHITLGGLLSAVVALTVLLAFIKIFGGTK